MSGRQLFAEENSEALTIASHQWQHDTNTKSLAAAYQIILKARWDSLTAEDQANWCDRAEKQAADVGK